MNELLTLAQAAKEIGLSPVTLRAYTDPNSKLRPKLKANVVGRAKVVTRADFEAWKVERQKHQAESKSE